MPLGIVCVFPSVFTIVTTCCVWSTILPSTAMVSSPPGQQRNKARISPLRAQLANTRMPTMDAKYRPFFHNGRVASGSGMAIWLAALAVSSLR